MSSNVPWKELAVVGVTTLGVCCAIGWFTGADNLEKKKKGARGGPNGATQESAECDALISMAENAMKKGAYADVEMAYPALIKNYIPSSFSTHDIHMMSLYMNLIGIQVPESIRDFI
jgi:hypothetical protein